MDSIYLISMLLAIMGTATTRDFKFTTKKWPNDRIFHREETVRISCETNDREANVTFTTGKDPVKTQSEFNGRLRQDGQTFYIDHFQMSDTGEVICIASRGTVPLGRIKLGNLHIHNAPCRVEPMWVKDHQKFHSYQAFKKVHAHEARITRLTLEKNDKLKIHCLAEGDTEETGCSALTVEKISGVGSGPVKHRTCQTKWLILNETGNGGVHKDGHYTHDMLFLLDEDIDVNTSGVYRCKRSLALAYDCPRNSSTFADITVTVTPPSPPVINLQKLQKVKEYGRLVVRCNVSASPVPDIRITDYRGKVLMECLRKRHCEHQTSVNRKSRNYSCIANNTEDRATAVLGYVVLFKPRDLITRHKGHTLWCSAKGNPNVSISWFSCVEGTQACKSWTPISAADDNYMIENTMEMLANPRGQYDFHSKSELRVLDATDSGMFKCIAKNSQGVKESQPFTLHGSRSTLIVILSVSLVAVVGVCVVIMFCYRKFVMHRYAPLLQENKKFKVDPEKSLFAQSNELPYLKEYEFPRFRLKLLSVVGSGQFGEVWMAQARGLEWLNPTDKSFGAAKRRALLKLNRRFSKKILPCVLQGDAWDNVQLVAAKKLKDTYTQFQTEQEQADYRDLASEIKVLIHLGRHPNIVNLLGACTSPGGKLIAIMEYCDHGDLMNFLKKRRGKFYDTWERMQDSYDEFFCHMDSINAAMQIARGMAFLSTKKLLHRDLAARNILVCENFKLKIADFGLARDVQTNDVYMKVGTGALPVKWMAPESIFEKKYTVKSDVWSFGIVLWEICTMGGSPYPRMDTESLFLFLQQRNIMSQPECCPEELYELMKLCWCYDLEDRPTFQRLVEILEFTIKSKTTISTNLATFEERLKSLSDETDGLIQITPSNSPRRNSVDEILEMRRGPAFVFPRQMSLDPRACRPITNFPPAEDDQDSMEMDVFEGIDEETRFTGTENTKNFDSTTTNNNDSCRNDNRYVQEEIHDYKNVAMFQGQELV